MPSEPSHTGRSEADLGGVPKIRVIFMGTPRFSATILGALLDAGYHVVAAYTKPDAKSGRKREVIPSAVKRLALERDIPIEQPVRFDAETVTTLRAYEPDLVVVAAFGKILPKTVLDIPGFGCVNVHASLLPRLRGASPVQNALLSGDKETGITIMLMDEGMDTGDILATTRRQIAEDDTLTSLLETLADDGSKILLSTLPAWVERRIEPMPQDESLATVCQLIERDDGRIFWNLSAEAVFNRFRGLSPWPGIFTFWKQSDGGYIRLKLPRISIQRTDPAMTRAFGEVFEIGERIAIQTGKGLVFIEEIQPEGKAPMPIRDFLNGRPEFIGSVLG